MANAFVQLPDDSLNTGKKEDHFTVANGNYREAVVIGDPSTVAAVAPVSATNGLAVDAKTLAPDAASASNQVTAQTSLGNIDTSTAAINTKIPASPSTTGKQDTGNTSLAAIDTNAGTTADASVTGDNTGTLSAKLRGINKILADVWNSGSHFLKVSIQNATLAVTQSGTWDIGTVTTVTAVTDITNPVTVIQPTAANLLATASQGGTWTVQPGNTANTTPWLVTAGHGKTIKSLSGSISGDSDIISAVPLKRIKVVGYAFFTFGTSATTILLKSNGTSGTLLWTVAVQAITGSVMGANMAVSVPSFIFATAAGEKLTADINTGDTVYWSISYFDDDAT
jgi:hypothetical protein